MRSEFRVQFGGRDTFGSCEHTEDYKVGGDFSGECGEEKKVYGQALGNANTGKTQDDEDRKGSST